MHLVVVINYLSEDSCQGGEITQIRKYEHESITSLNRIFAVLGKIGIVGEYQRIIMISVTF